MAVARWRVAECCEASATGHAAKAAAVGAPAAGFLVVGVLDLVSSGAQRGHECGHVGVDGHLRALAARDVQRGRQLDVGHERRERAVRELQREGGEP